MRVLLNYLSKWIMIIFLVWLVMYKMNIDISNYINMYYLSILLLIGYILFIFLDMMIKGNQYELSFFLVSVILHSIPLLILCQLNETSKKYALETLIIVIIMYYLYLRSINKTVFDPYFSDPVPRNWYDLLSFIKK